MEEIFDVYNRNGKYIGTKSKTFCHSKNPGVYHKPVWIWMINELGQILVQKRAKCKKKFPLLFDMPSAGHVDAGESEIDACIRETYEELGISISPDKFIFLKEFIIDEWWEIAQVYLVNIDSNTKFKISKEEVSEVRWLEYDEFKELFLSDSFVPFNNEYKQFVLDMLEKNINKNI